MNITASKVWFTENFLVLPVIALAAAVVSYWALAIDRTAPIDLENGYIIPSEITPGSEFVVRWNLTRLRREACSVVVSRQIIDSTNVVWRKAEQQIYDTMYPTQETIARNTQVPFGASWGPAKYRLLYCSRCEGFSLTRWFPVCVQEADIPFNISPPPAKPGG